MLRLSRTILRLSRTMLGLWYSVIGHARSQLYWENGDNILEKERK